MIRPNCRGMDDCRYTRPKSVQYEARADRMNTLSALKFANSPVRSFTTACTSLPSTLCCTVNNTRVKQTFNAVRPFNPSKCFVCVCMCSTRQQIRCSRIRKFLTRRQSVRVCVCVCVLWQITGSNKKQTTWVHFQKGSRGMKCANGRSVKVSCTREWLWALICKILVASECVSA